MNFIVTGASRGIGFQTVLKLAESEGNRVIAIARDREKLNQLLLESSRKQPNSEVIPIVFDLQQTDLFDSVLIPQIKEYFTYADVLINNAGLLVNSAFDQLSLLEMMQMLTVNFIAPAYLTKLIIPLMAKDGMW
jgi:short-subunit dehydrogenase